VVALDVRRLEPYLKGILKAVLTSFVIFLPTSFKHL
jgi:hypothetical protein